MTVPKRFRRFKEIPAGLQLHYAGLSAEFVTIKNRVPVTTPLKTLLDLLSSELVPRHHLLEAMQQCDQSGLIHRNDILEADLTKSERQLVLDCYQNAAKFIISET